MPRTQRGDDRIFEMPPSLPPAMDPEAGAERMAEDYRRAREDDGPDQGVELTGSEWAEVTDNGQDLSAAPGDQAGPDAQEIEREAYSLYCERGCVDGYDQDDWFEAERRVRTRRDGALAERPGPVS
jgi:hypothetical protein